MDKNLHNKSFHQQFFDKSTAILENISLITLPTEIFWNRLLMCLQKDNKISYFLFTAIVSWTINNICFGQFESHPLLFLCSHQYHGKKSLLPYALLRKYYTTIKMNKNQWSKWTHKLQNDGLLILKKKKVMQAYLKIYKLNIFHSRL